VTLAEREIDEELDADATHAISKGHGHIRAISEWVNSVQNAADGGEMNMMQALNAKGRIGS
jgi:hypothetical protein